ncbi:transcriptional regulator PtsJ, partial [Salmonella enterica subsp. enterica serovar Infantis]
PHLSGDSPVSTERLAWASRVVRDATDVAGDIVLTRGAIAAIVSLLCAHLLAGDSVALEDPCFFSCFNMLRYGGFSASPVSVDSEGM